MRSGVLTSVHAFSTDPSRGTFILIYLMVVVGGALALYSWRVPLLGSRAKFTLFSKETALLLNNIFLVVSCATVLLGTLFPLLMDALGGGKFSVGPPYFTQVLVPIWLPMMFLMAISVHWHWKQNQWQKINRATYGILLTGLVIGLPMPLLFGEWRWGVALALSIAWAVAASALWAVQGTQDLAALAQRNMDLHLNIQDGHVWVSSEAGEANLQGQILKAAQA